MSTYQGLVNEGATCYLNSLIQTLYMTYEFRENVYAYQYIFIYLDMIQKKFQKKIVFLINYKNCLLIFKSRINHPILVVFWKVFNGLMLKPSNSMMSNSFAENFSKPLKRHIKTLHG